MQFPVLTNSQVPSAPIVQETPIFGNLSYQPIPQIPSIINLPWMQNIDLKVAAQMEESIKVNPLDFHILTFVSEKGQATWEQIREKFINKISHPNPDDFLWLRITRLMDEKNLLQYANNTTYYNRNFTLSSNINIKSISPFNTPSQHKEKKISSSTKILSAPITSPPLPLAPQDQNRDKYDKKVCSMDVESTQQQNSAKMATTDNKDSSIKPMSPNIDQELIQPLPIKDVTIDENKVNFLDSTPSNSNNEDFAMNSYLTDQKLTTLLSDLWHNHDLSQFDEKSFFLFENQYNWL